MNHDKSFKFAQRWRKLAEARTDLDWQITEFARDLRAEFLPGLTGDEMLIRWCETEVGSAAVGKELILRATVREVVTEPKRYKEIGGFAGARWVLPLEKRQQIHVIQSAAKQNKKIRTVMREQGLIKEPALVKAPSVDGDVRALAAFVLSLPPNKVPANVLLIAGRYAKRQRRA